MKKILILAASTIILTACNKEDNFTDEQPIAAMISATIGNNSLSRASETSWDKDDAIGISMSDRYSNVKYTTANGDGFFVGKTTLYFKNKKDAVTLTAYHPFTGTDGVKPSAIEASTDVEYQTPLQQSKFDFLFAKKENVTGSNPEVKFDFSHRMSKLTLIFKNGNGAEVSNITSYKIEGLILDGTFDTSTGSCVAKSNSGTRPLNFTVSEGDIKNEVPLSSLILFPQALDGKTVRLTITDNQDQEYTCLLNFKDNSIESGNNYQFKITVNKSGLVIGNSTITGWNIILPDSEIDAL